MIGLDAKTASGRNSKITSDVPPRAREARGLVKSIGRAPVTDEDEAGGGEAGVEGQGQQSSAPHDSARRPAEAAAGGMGLVEALEASA